MEQQDLFGHDAFSGMMPYLDAVSRTRLPEASRIGAGNNLLCAPDANVFRTHRVNGSCPPYASTFNANCCENSFPNANQNANLNANQASDRELLKALKHGYQFSPSPRLRATLQEILPELSNWFDSGQNSIAALPAAPPNHTLTLNEAREWFHLVMKFYILVRPEFTIQANDTFGNTHVVFENSQVRLNTHPISDRVLEYVQEVGAAAVAENTYAAPPFVPYPIRCRTYNCYGGAVNITNMADVVSDPLCGLRGRSSIKFEAVAVVNAGVSWVTTLVNTFLAMSRREGLKYFYLRVYHTGPTKVGIPAGINILPVGMPTLPQATGDISGAQQYQMVVNNLVLALPGNSWKVSEFAFNRIPARWSKLWTIYSELHSYRFQLQINKKGTIAMKCES